MSGAAGSPAGGPGARALVAACALAVAVRLALAAFGPMRPPVSDGAHYDRIGRSLLAGNGFGEAPGYRTSHRAPLQPLWLAFVHLVAPESERAGAVAGALLGALLVPSLAVVAGRLGGAGAARLAAFAAALHPRLIDYCVRLWSLSETLALVLLLAALACWQAAERGRRGAAALAGALFGLAALTRPVTLAFPLLLALRWRRAGTGVAVALAAWAAALLPWTIRNALVWGRFVPVSTMGGIVFFQGFHPPEEGWGHTPWPAIEERTRGITGGEPAVSDALVRETLADIGAAPAAAASLLPLKLLHLLNPYSETGERLDAVWLATFLAGGIGAWRLRRDPSARVPLFLVGWIVASALVFYGSPRFRLPAEAVWLAFAAAAVAPATATPRGRRRLLACGLAIAALPWLPGLDRESVKGRIRDRVVPRAGAGPGR